MLRLPRLHTFLTFLLFLHLYHGNQHRYAIATSKQGKHFLGTGVAIKYILRTRLWLYSLPLTHSHTCHTCHTCHWQCDRQMNAWLAATETTTKWSVQATYWRRYNLRDDKWKQQTVNLYLYLTLHNCWLSCALQLTFCDTCNK